jgi:hypothetical protein
MVTFLLPLQDIVKLPLATIQKLEGKTDCETPTSCAKNQPVLSATLGPDRKPIDVVGLENWS